MNKYVSELTHMSQNILVGKLYSVLSKDYQGEELQQAIENAMNSRLSDLTDTVPSYFLEALD